MSKSMLEDTKTSSATPIYNKVGFFKILAAAFAIIASVIGGICFGIYFDTKSMYFTDSSLVRVFFGVIAIILIGSLAISIISRSKILPCKQRPRIFLGIGTGIGLLFLLDPSMMKWSLEKNLLIILVLICAIIYFTGFAQISKSKISPQIILGFFAVIWCVVMIAVTYFDYSAAKVAVNSHYEILCQFGMAFSMLFIVSELRYDLDSGREWMYKFSGCMAFCINLLATVAYFVIFAKGRADLGIYAFPAISMTVYSAKIFFIAEAPKEEIVSNTQAKADTEDNQSDTNPTQERTQIDENID